MGLMGSLGKCPDTTLSAGDKFHGFQIRRVEKIPEIRVTAYEAEHEKTGAKVLHLHCDDGENLYAIGFRTPPGDSTGVPHILEHSVLAGSERYPLKDAFNELHKGTLQTFINAFTYPDKTIYPVASQVRTDFFNLARVYTDLVLHPRLLKETFRQEGHHLEFEKSEDPASELVISGIVYNEMKGAYSSPDSLMYKMIQEKLYPETAYAFDSGGNPDDIPLLTYEHFKAFHRIYYSPSNARFFLYGDIPTADHLSFLSGMLAGFDRVEVNSVVSSQPTWRKPSSVHGTYPIGRQENTQSKTAINVAWMMAENTDDETAILLQITSGILIGSAAGPLRKALIDSGLGEDMSPVSGIERDLKQIAFVVGLRGSDPEKGPRVETLILDILRNLVISGFDRELVEGTLHQVEFHGKEIVRNTYPYGIVLMGRVFHTWLYDGDPLVGLNFPRIIEDIRKKWEAHPGLFQEIVQTWFLDNPHRLLSVLKPSHTYQSRLEKAYRKRMSVLKASLSGEELENVRREAESLKKFQVEPDTPAAIASLPKLRVSDISRTIERIPTVTAVIYDLPGMTHDLFTNGIAYLDLAFDISDIPEDLQPYLPLLGKLMINMGAAGMNYEEMAKRIALKTGGIGYHLSAGMTTDGRTNWQKMIFRVKSLYRNVRDGVNILSDILIAGDLSSEPRMRDLIAERKNGLQASVVPSGHIFARRAAGSSFSIPAYRDEQWHGRTQLRFMNHMAERFESRKGELHANLARLREMIFRKEKLFLNLTADQEGLSLLSDGSADLVSRLSSDGGRSDPGMPDLSPIHVGVAIPAQVAYVAMVLPAPTYADPLSAPLFLLARELSSGYLYKQIRVQGGAYGGMSQYDPVSGIFALLSYRDPHIVKTLNVYRDAFDFISRNRMSRDDLEKAIIGTIGALDKPMDPSSRGYMAMMRDFTGLSDDDRLKFRSDILDMTPKSLHEAARRYFDQAAGAAVVAVYAADENLRKANEVLETKLRMELLTK
jgi:Zn-dependent M16 (insulinase) family peptidase